MISKKVRPTSLISLLIYISPIVLLILVIMTDLNVNGTRSFVYDIGKDSAVISQLFPAQRLEGVKLGKQKIVSQPIYFNVLYPHRYDTAIVTIEAENLYNKEWKIGIQRTGNDDWIYDLYEPDKSGTASIPLQNSRVTDRRIRFILSIDEVGISELYISRIEVILRRNPLF